nr:MAG TPA: portal protein [Caudoviricetes sp.]
MSDVSLWTLYQEGIAYHNKMGFTTKFPTFVRFKEGDQWPQPTERTKNLPRPVLNIIEMIVRNKRSSVLDQPVSIVYRQGGATNNEIADQMQQDAAENMTEYARKVWDRADMDKLCTEAVDDAATNGTGIWHFYWDNSIKGGQNTPYVGELRGESVDALNFFVANPQVRDVQKQDYIIIAQRMKVIAARTMAKKKGLPDAKIELILPDEFDESETYRAARIELDGKENEKVTVLTKYYRKNGEVVYDKATRSVDICTALPLTPADTKAKIKLYPVAAMNWKLRKACFYGIGEVEGLIPNQKLINFMQGMQGFAIQQMGFPKIITRPGALKQPLTNEPGEIITDYANGGISYLSPPPFSSAAAQLCNDMIDLTRVVTGTTEVATGESMGANMAASAIIALQNQAQTPVNEIQRHFWRAVKEIGRIWLEFFKTYCSDEREIVVEMGDEMQGRTFVGSEYAEYDFDLQVDVGASSEYSAVLAQATLDKMLDRGDITIDQYIELSDPNVAPFKEKFKRMREAQPQAVGMPGVPEEEVNGVQSVSGVGGVPLPDVPKAPTVMDKFTGGGNNAVPKL